jgi:hypothetical protein
MYTCIKISHYPLICIIFHQAWWGVSVVLVAQEVKAGGSLGTKKLETRQGKNPVSKKEEGGEEERKKGREGERKREKERKGSYKSYAIF